MKVLCVDGQRRPEDIGNEPLLCEGECYLVENEVYGTTSKGTVVECYKLASIDFPHVYVKNRFVICMEGADWELGVHEQNKAKRNEWFV